MKFDVESIIKKGNKYKGKKKKTPLFTKKQPEMKIKYLWNSNVSQWGRIINWYRTFQGHIKLPLQVKLMVKLSVLYSFPETIYLHIYPRTVLKSGAYTQRLSFSKYML